MPRTTEELASVRDAIRRQWLLPVPPGLLPAAEILDTSEETLALLSRQRLLSAPLARALRSGNPDAIAAAAPRPPSGPPRGTGRYRTFTGNYLQFPSLGTSFSEIFNFPYLIEEIVVTAGSRATAAPNARVIIELYSTGEGPAAVGARPATGTKLWPLEPSQGNDATILFNVLNGTQAATFRILQPVTSIGQRLGVFIQSDDALMQVSFAVLLQEIDLGQWTPADLIPIGRDSFSPAARPPTPRLPTRPNPRGAIIRVTQAGRVLAERRISWEALDSSIRAKWFNQQVGEPPDPSVEWIQ